MVGNEKIVNMIKLDMVLYREKTDYSSKTVQHNVEKLNIEEKMARVLGKENLHEDDNGARYSLNNNSLI